MFEPPRQPRRGRERALGLLVEWLRRTGGRGTVGDRDRNLIESVSRLLNSLSDLRELTQRAMELAVEQFDAERGVLLLAGCRERHARCPMAEHGARGCRDAPRRGELQPARGAARGHRSGGSLLIWRRPVRSRAPPPTA